MLPTVQRDFTGSVTKQIRDLRAFFQGSAFFKVYQKRALVGGFIDDPEYPYVAIDEAIVNAVAHRDYAVGYAIECRYYKDAFVVSNARRILQRDGDVPDHFTLATTQLVSTPRNAHLMEWLRRMRDSNGAAFVQALGEGAKKMKAEMRDAGLPPPEYRTEMETTVVLRSNAPGREALLRTAARTAATEYANLFPLTIQSTSPAPWLEARKEIRASLKAALQSTDWFIDRDHHGRIVAHRHGAEFPLPDAVSEVLKLFPAYSFQLYELYGQAYLCIDYTVEVKNILRLPRLLPLHVPVTDLVGRRALVQWQGWQVAKILSIDNEHTTPDVREGITKFGAYDPQTKTIELVPICMDAMREQMAALIDRLKVGKHLYRGAERTFKTRFTYGSIVTAPTPELIQRECQRVLDEHPDWHGNAALNRVFLVHAPEARYAIDDERSPYYRVKRLLLERGIPCQMVDTPTLRNPDYKDLNLALNLAAIGPPPTHCAPNRSRRSTPGISRTSPRHSCANRLRLPSTRSWREPHGSFNTHALVPALRMTARVCLFCGMPLIDRAREHVFPQWLIEHLGDARKNCFRASHKQRMERYWRNGRIPPRTLWKVVSAATAITVG